MAAFNLKFDPLATTATDLQSLLTSGQLTSVEIVEVYLAQIEAHNRRGLGLRAIASLPDRDVLFRQARELDDERRNGKHRGPLHGIPIVIKDSVITGPDLSTTAGAVAFQGARTSRNAVFIDQLREAGMIILGKGSMTEFCGLRAQGMTAGYSATNGQTQSPYIEGGRKPDDGIAGHTSAGGSSSGSAVAVAAGFAPVSIGTDTVGSIVLPANRAALYALRLTTANVDVEGVFRLARGWDTIGPMAKAPEDLAPLIEAMVTPGARKKLPTGGLRTVLDGKWDDLRLGFVDFDTWTPLGQFEASTKKELDQMRTEYNGAIKKLQGIGVKVTHPIEVPFQDGVKYQGKSTMFINYAQLKSLFQEWTKHFTEWEEAVSNTPITSLKDLVEFNENHSKIAMPKPHEDQTELMRALEDTTDLAETEELAQNLHRLAREGLLSIFDSPTNPIDIIIAPSDSMLISPVAAAGFAAGVVPMGYLEPCGQPQGITLAAKADGEAILLHFMSAWEKTFPKRRVPPMLEREATKINRLEGS